MWFALLMTNAHADAPKITLEGRVQLDYVRSLDTPPEEPGQGFQIRRARAAAKLHFSDKVWGKLDVSLKKLTLTDLYANLGPKKVSVRIGRQKMPTTHAYLESSRFIPFAERPMLVAALAVDRTVGVMVHGTLGRFTYEVAGGETTPFTPDERGAEAYLRGTFKPDDHLKLGLWGSAGSWNAFAPEFETVTGHPWSSLNVPLDGLITREGIDLVLLTGPFRVDAELVAMEVSGDRPLTTAGGYADLLWMVTGESQRVGKRLEPEHPITDGGVGAFQLGVRMEQHMVRGATKGNATALTGGINWFPQAHVKVPIDLVHTRSAGITENAVQIRFQIEG